MSLGATLSHHPAFASLVKWYNDALVKHGRQFDSDKRLRVSPRVLEQTKALEFGVARGGSSGA